MAVTFPDDAEDPDPRFKLSPAAAAAIQAATASARRATADITASVLPMLQTTETLRSAMLPSMKAYEQLTASLMPTRQVNEMLAAALQVNMPQIEALNAHLAQLVRIDVNRMMPALGITPAKLVLPHLEDMLSAARIAREVSGGAYESALAALQSLEVAFEGDVDEEFEELLREGGLLEGDEREQALDDAARIADLAQQSGASAIDLQQVIAWFSKKLAESKDLFTAQRIGLFLAVITAAAQLAALALQWSDQGEVADKVTQLERKVDEGIEQQHADQRETNEVLRRIEELLERQANDDADDETGQHDQP